MQDIDSSLTGSSSSGLVVVIRVHVDGDGCLEFRVWESCGGVCKGKKERVLCLRQNFIVQFFRRCETLQMGVCVDIRNKKVTEGKRRQSDGPWPGPALIRKVASSWWRGN